MVDDLFKQFLGDFGMILTFLQAQNLIREN